ncbi:MAG TPA: alpha/beta hydrolase [Devosia sp.]|nr:alpha/beta hydrolase [Devosia sp.]
MSAPTYRFAEREAPADAPLLFLFHGTGGDETDLLGLGHEVMPGARLVAPRGDVTENGAPRFFRRLAMGVYDMADLARATAKMSAFMRERIAETKPSLVAALGYSNGANILAAVLFETPDLIDRAVLMHPLIPFAPAAQPRLAHRKVLITAGRRDPIAPVQSTESLAAYFQAQGAVVTLAWHDGGHEVRPQEIAAAQLLLTA